VRLRLIAVALVVATTAVAPTAAGAATLQQQINSLKTKVTGLQKKVNTMKSKLDCFAFIAPLSVYGDSDGTFGYIFDNNDGGGSFYTSGLDLTAEGQAAGGWFVYVRPRCAPSVARAASGTFGGQRLRLAAPLATTRTQRSYRPTLAVANHKTRPE
jgi:hypothetical protein